MRQRGLLQIAEAEVRDTTASGFAGSGLLRKNVRQNVDEGT